MWDLAGSEPVLWHPQPSGVTAISWGHWLALEQELGGLCPDLGRDVRTGVEQFARRVRAI